MAYRLVAALTSCLVLAGATLPAASATTPSQDMTEVSQDVARDLSFVLAAAGPASMALGVLRANGFANPSLTPVRTDAMVAAGSGAAIHDGVVDLLKVYAKTTVCLATIALDYANRAAAAGPVTCMSRPAALRGTAAALALEVTRRLAAAMSAGAAGAGTAVTPLVAFNAAKAEALAAGKGPSRKFAAGRGTERGRLGAITAKGTSYLVKTRHKLATGSTVTCVVTVTTAGPVATVPDPAVKPPACR